MKDWLLSAEYVLSQGNRGVDPLRARHQDVRGQRPLYAGCHQHSGGFGSWTHLPIIVDPSHAAGKRDYVPSIAAAGMAAGAHGLIVEVHYCPSEAQCDGPQALLPETFRELMQQLRKIAAIFNKEFAEPATARRANDTKSRSH